MSMELVQYADGTASLQNMTDNIDDMHVGGPAVPSGAVPRHIVSRFMKMALADVDAAAGIVSWHNTGNYPMIVVNTVLDVTTIATGACTVDVGTATTAIDANNLISAQDVHSATGVFAASTVVKIPVGSFLTASTKTGASAGMVGYLYVEMVPATL